MSEFRPDRAPTEFPFPAKLFEPEEEKPALSLFAMLTFVVRQLKFLLIIPLIAFAIAASLTLSGDPQYAAAGKFLPANSDAGGSGGGLAEELKGIIGGRGRGNSDLMFYGELVESSVLLRDAARTEYEFTALNDEGEPVRMRGTIARLHGIVTEDERLDLSTSLSMLQGMVSYTLETGTGFVVVETQAQWPGLAVAINNRVLELVNEFNVMQRQSQATAERKFVEQRLAEAKAALERAETDLMNFVSANQQFQPLSRVGIRLQQMEREVTLKQGIYTTLAQAYEQARISEVRNTPIVTVVEQPEYTVHEERGGSAVRNGMFAFIVALIIMIGYVVLRSYLRKQTEANPKDFEEFRRVALSGLPERLRGRLPGNGSGNGSPPAVPAGGLPEEDDRAW